MRWMDTPILQHRLSKSRYLNGLQCLRQLWWRTHEPHAVELIPDFETRARFEEGHRVGERARRRFPHGVMITGPYDDLPGRVVATRRALEQGAAALFEASFMADSVYVAVDVLERLADGFALIEVKSSTEVRSEHVDDATIQTWVARRNGLDIRRVEVMHLNYLCVHPHLEDLFIRADVTEAVEQRLEALPANLARQLDALEGPIPEVAIGPHCRSPRPCPFRSRCWVGMPRHHVTNLYRIGGKAFELAAAGYRTIDQVPDDVEIDPIAARQRRAIREGRRIVEPGLAAALAGFESPLAYLDFETVAPAIPAWPGCHPYESVPVQFSLRVERPQGVEAVDWIAEEGTDPRRELAARLVAACAGSETIIAYNAEFEARGLRHLETAVPEHAPALAAIRERLRDPLPLLREYVYDPAFHGGFGLKAVAPVLAPEVRYDTGIGGGGAATVLLSRLLIEGEPNDLFERGRVRESLRRYCALDTLATQRVVERLRDLAAEPQPES